MTPLIARKHTLNPTQHLSDQSERVIQPHMDPWAHRMTKTALIQPKPHTTIMSTHLAVTQPKGGSSKPPVRSNQHKHGSPPSSTWQLSSLPVSVLGDFSCFPNRSTRGQGYKY
jgi:hypothetical protein